MAVLAFSVEADEVGFAVNGVLQSEFREVGIGRVNIVQVDVLNGYCDDRAASDIRLGQKEQGGIAHEVLNVGQAELGLHGDVGRSEILVQVKDVSEANNLGHGLSHLVELVENATLRQSNRRLPSISRASQRASIQEGVETGQHIHG